MRRLGFCHKDISHIDFSFYCIYDIHFVRKGKALNKQLTDSFMIVLFDFVRTK